MKENNSMNVKIVNLKEYSCDEVGLLVQVVLIELLIIFAVINIVTNVFMPAFYAILAMLMFTMAYNNRRIYKRKNMTFVYIIVGIFVTVSTLLEYVF
jgi:hypothetical protein